MDKEFKTWLESYALEWCGNKNIFYDISYKSGLSKYGQDLLAAYKAGQQSKVEVPSGGVVTRNCGQCDWCVRGSAGHKLSCGNFHILAERPYVDNVNGKNRTVVADKRPDWCPLGKGN